MSSRKGRKWASIWIYVITFFVCLFFVPLFLWIQSGYDCDRKKFTKITVVLQMFDNYNRGKALLSSLSMIIDNRKISLAFCGLKHTTAGAQHINRTQQDTTSIQTSILVTSLLSIQRCCQMSSNSVKVYPRAQWCSRKSWQWKKPICMSRHLSLSVYYLLVSCLSASVSSLSVCLSLWMLLSQLSAVAVCKDLRGAWHHHFIALRYVTTLTLCSKWSMASVPEE